MTVASLTAGRRNRLITFEARTGTQDATYGTRSYGWADHAQEWAEVQDILPSRGENFADGLEIQRRPTRIRTLYRDDITSDMRVKVGDRTLEIIAGPVELGNREGLEMVCEDYSSEGDAP